MAQEGPTQVDLLTTLTTPGDNEAVELDKPTPLPKFQLLSVYLIQLAEPITALVIYPFINQFIRETGVTNGDERRTGYYAGVIESAFFFAECLTALQWGYLSDRYGRRPIVLIGPLGLTFAMFLFGTSTTFWSLVVTRCFQGIFNGNIGVAKSIIAEITDSSNRGDAYAFVTLIWSIGQTTGPLIGGVLSNPAKRWPDTLGRISYLRTHPYFLPCAVAETLSSLVAEEKRRKLRNNISGDEIAPVATEETPLLGETESRVNGSQHNPPESSILISPIQLNPRSEENNEPKLRSILTRPILMTLINQVSLTFTDMCHFVLLPLMYSTSIPLGGLGLDPFRIGTILGSFGFVNAFIQANLLGRLIRKFGARKIYMISFSALFFCFMMYPIMSHFARRAGRVDGFVVACIIVQLACQTVISMAYGSLQVVLVENVPEGGPMGTVNGVAQMLSSGMRTIGPTFVSSLFSISLQRGLASGNMVYYLLMSMTLVGIRCTVLLPKKFTEKRSDRCHLGDR
ncbi:major facilitator superfamily multidrug-resistance, DHA1 sub-family [Flammula alnicola]|nr:major facilitator superfamily multidrug-resistance, DHA1 sub-family [Flammula alnicola]